MADLIFPTFDAARAPRVIYVGFFMATVTVVERDKELGAACHGRVRNKTGLTILEEARLRRRLRRQAPSEPWVDVQFRNIQGMDEQGRPLVKRIHDPRLFPPGGARTAMVRCPECGAYMPPMAFENGVCLDHAEQGNWGPSPSAQAIHALQFRNLRMSEVELAPESTHALRREIQRYHRKRRR